MNWVEKCLVSNHIEKNTSVSLAVKVSFFDYDNVYSGYNSDNNSRKVDLSNRLCLDKQVQRADEIINFT
jgi:hypothetical protein